MIIDDIKVGSALPPCIPNNEAYRHGIGEYDSANIDRRDPEGFVYIPFERLTFLSLSIIRMHLLFGLRLEEQPYKHTAPQPPQPHKIKKLNPHNPLNLETIGC